MVRNDHTYEPFVLFEYRHKPGTFGLMLSDDRMIEVVDVFEEHGREGNGYAWSDVAIQAVRKHAPDLEGRFQVDPEAGTFAAFGEDREVLKELGALLQEAFYDPAKLGELVAAAPYEWD